MWRIRMRLLFGFVVLLVLGHLPQERSVLAQKYYMNFAFNNNNPDGEEGVGGKTSPPQDGHVTNEPGQSGDNGHIGGTGDAATGAEGNADAGEGSAGPEDTNGNAGENGDAGEDGGGGGYQGEDGSGNGNGKGNQVVNGNGNGDGNGNGNAAHQPTGGKDDDNDDSDSKDPKDRRHKLAEQEDKSRKRKDHSHHSSYEISIDDSFGGRYVRSIYESSESHGHSGSRAGTNEHDSGDRESSQESKKQAPKDDDNTKNTENPGTNGAVGVEVPDATEGAGIARNGDNNDYEEM